MKPLTLGEVQKIREASETDIYLCGDGQLAGWLLINQQIDRLKIKLNPVVLGTGTKLFENVAQPYKLDLLSSEAFDDGLQLITYRIRY